MRLLLPCLTLALLTGAPSGCNRLSGPPQFTQVGITSSQLRPEEVATITIKVEDANDIVDRIEGFVKENPSVQFSLKDDGQEADAQAGDGIWSMYVEVPVTAPTGNFELEFTAFRSDGQPIEIRDEDGNAVPLRASVPVNIQSNPE